MKKIVSLILVVALLSLSAIALADTYGLGLVFAISGAHSKDAAADADGTIEVNTTGCALTLGADGKIVAISFDVAQAKGTFTAAGVITSEKDVALRTKKELGDDYGMRAASPIGKEVGEQIDALEAWCIGKTPDEVASGAADDADLKAGCTIHVDDFLAALAKAAANAK